MSLSRWIVRTSPIYRELWHKHEALREQYALLSSLHGADGPATGANCDSELMKKFVALEADYRALEKECAELRVKALVYDSLARLIRGVRDFL